MKKRLYGKFLFRSLGTGAGALATLGFGAPVYAADSTVAELTQPSSTVEAGVGSVSRGSFKFGEYNGL